MDGGVEVFPDESIVLHISISHINIFNGSCADNDALNKVLLSDISSGQIADAVDRDYANIFNSSE